MCFSAEVSGGFSFGPNSMVVLTVKPSYDRDQLIANAAPSGRNKRSTATVTGGVPSRNKRSTSQSHKHTVSVNFRTARDSGIVYFAGSSDEYILIQVSVCCLPKQCCRCSTGIKFGDHHRQATRHLGKACSYYAIATAIALIPTDGLCTIQSKYSPCATAITSP